MATGNSNSADGFGRAMVLAALCGSKIALGPAFLRARRRHPHTAAWVAAAAGEMALDKVGVFPARYNPALLAPHAAAGAWVAREAMREEGVPDDPTVPILGAVVAAGVASLLPMARVILSKGLGVPDPLLGVAEDYMFLRLGSRATGMSMAEIKQTAVSSAEELTEQARPALQQFAEQARQAVPALDQVADRVRQAVPGLAGSGE
jgi:hypothetical protein